MHAIWMNIWWIKNWIKMLLPKIFSLHYATSYHAPMSQVSVCKCNVMYCTNILYEYWTCTKCIKTEYIHILNKQIFKCIFLLLKQKAHRLFQKVLWQHWLCCFNPSTMAKTELIYIPQKCGGIGSNGFHIKWIFGTQDNWKNENLFGRFGSTS